MHSCTNGTPLVAASVPLPVRTEPILLACALILCGAALGLGSDDGKKLLNLGRWSLGGKRKGIVCAWCTRWTRLTGGEAGGGERAEAGDALRAHHPAGE